MEKGKLGIRLSFYAVAAFILAFLGYSTVLALLTVNPTDNKRKRNRIVERWFCFSTSKGAYNGL